MTLKEKFEEVNILDYRFRERDLDSETLYIDAEKCEKIADDFAIGFAEWIDSDFYQGDDVNEYHKSILEYREGKIFTVKELLEIYKKEKL